MRKPFRTIERIQSIPTALMQNRILNKVLNFDWLWFAQWLVTNNFDKPLQRLKDSHDKHLDRILRRRFASQACNAELVLEETKELYEETVAGLKDLSDRQDKTLAMTLLAIGWNATTIKSQEAFRILVVVAVLLLLGRVFLSSVRPIQFRGLIKFEEHCRPYRNPTAQMQIALSRQYEMARVQNDFIAKWNQRRLLFASILLLLGLTVLMIGK